MQQPRLTWACIGRAQNTLYRRRLQSRSCARISRHIGGYARAGSTSRGSGTSREQRITGGVTAGSGVASWRADGLWTCVKGTVLICPGAASRRGLPYGGSTRSHGGSTRRQGHLGRFARLRLRCGNCRAAGGCHRASLMIKRSEAAAAVRPGPAAPFRLTALAVSAGHKPEPVARAGAAAPFRLRNAGPAGPLSC
jgi:hypothetical protein